MTSSKCGGKQTIGARAAMRGRSKTALARHAATRGFSLVEAMMAVVVLVVGLMAMLSSIAVTGRLSQMDHESSLAMEAMEQTLARLRSTEYSELYTRYGPGGTQMFPVPGLTSPGTALPGRIQLVTNETLSNAQLGLPRDLNGDGDAEDTDVSDSYVLMPVVVTVEWTGPTGLRRLQLRSLLAER